MLHNVLPRQLTEVGRERIEAALAAAGIEARPPATDTVASEEWLALHGRTGSD